MVNFKDLDDILQNNDDLSFKLFIESGAAAKSQSLLSGYKDIIVICDDNTKTIAQQLFVDKKIYSLGSCVKPTFKNVNQVIDIIKSANLLIAVGSGTINDICKYAAFINKTDYFVYATAPSMNGYFSITSSLISEDDNIKKSYLARVPTAIIMDLEIIANAPMRLIQSGLGDLLCRSTVYVDWLIGSQLFKMHKFNQKFCNILIKHEKNLLANIDLILKRDITAMQKMCEVIILQGAMMCVDNSSNPASQSEHMVAHLYNQLCSYNTNHTHGEEIALTTTMMLSLQKQILASSDLIFNIDNTNNYKDLPCFEIKLDCYKKLIANNMLNNNSWLQIKPHIEAIHYNSGEILSAFKKIGLPMTIDDLNWDYQKVKQAITEAAFYRERYTILDIAILTCRLQSFLRSIVNSVRSGASSTEV